MRILLTISLLFAASMLSAQVLHFDWAKGMLGGWVTPARLEITDSSNLVVAGALYGQTDFDPGAGVASLSSGNTSGFIAKYDSVGNYKWAINTINDPAGGFSGFNGFDVDDNENIYVAGHFNNKVDVDPSPDSAFIIPVGGGFHDFFLAKYDGNGNYLWAISGGDTAVAPYDETEMGMDVAVDNNGNVYFVGAYSFTTDFDPGPGVLEMTAEGAEDIFICKYDSAGNFQWVKSIGGQYKDWVRHVRVDGNGNIIISGYYTYNADFDPSAGTAILDTDYSGGGGTKGGFIAKYDSNGNYLWAISPEGSNIVEFNAHKMELDSFGNILLAGSYYGNSIDFDPSSSAGNGTNDGWGDFYLVKYDPNGNYLWSFVDGGAGTDGIDGLATDQSGNMYVFLHYADSVDVDPSANNYTVTAQGNSQVLVKYSSTGQLLFVEAFDPIGMQGMVVDNAHRITLAGVFAQTVDFDLSANDYLLTSNWYNLYLARYNHAVFVGQDELAISKNGWELFPNPSTGRISLNPIEVPDDVVELEVLNTFGQIIFQKSSVVATMHELDLTHLETGNYWIRIYTNAQNTVLPLVITH